MPSRLLRLATLARCRRSGLRPQPGRGTAGRRRAQRAARARRARRGPRRRLRDQGASGSLEAEEVVAGDGRGRGRGERGALPRGRPRGARGPCCCASTPSATGSRPQRAEATYKKALADQHRAEADLKRREELARAAARGRRGAEPLAGRDRAPDGGGRRRQGGLGHRARRTCAARRCGPAAPASSTRATVETGPVRQGRRRAGDPRRHEPAAPALQGLRSASRCGRAKATASASAWPPSASATSRRRIYHVGEVADPATRQVEVLAWVKNPGVLKPGFFAEVDAGHGDAPGRHGGARGRDPGQRAAASSSTSWKAARRGCGRSRSACAPATASSRSSRASKAGETVVVEGLRPAAPTASRSRSPSGAPDGARGVRRRGARSERRGARPPAPDDEPEDPTQDRHRDDPGGHLDPQPRLRLDADGRASSASACICFTGCGERRARPRASARTPTSTSRSSTSRSPTRAPRPRSWRRTSSTSSRTRSPRSRASSRSPPPRARARPASRSSSSCRATSTRRSRTCRRRWRRRRAACRARWTRPIITKNNPEDQPIMWLSLAGEPPAHVPGRLRPQRAAAAVPDHRGRGRDHARRLPRAQRSASGSTRRAWRPQGLTVQDVIAAIEREHLEVPAGRIETPEREMNVRAEGEAIDLEAFRQPGRRLPQGRAGPAQRRGGGRGRPRGPPAHRRAPTASPRSASASRSCAAPTRSRWAERSRPRWRSCARHLPEGLTLNVNFDEHRSSSRRRSTRSCSRWCWPRCSPASCAGCSWAPGRRR